MPRTIVRMLFGSHLYGTDTPASDFDYKSVFVPDGRAILLQRVNHVSKDAREKGWGEKNYAGEAEEEKISVQRFLKLASEGQTMALDMLFAPPLAYTEPPGPEWLEIIANRHRLLTRQAAAFVGYARQQANRYGIKGSRVAAARTALALLDVGANERGGAAKLEELAERIFAIMPHEHMGWIEDTTPHGQTVLMWEVCNRKMPYTASIKSARDIMARVVDEYGRRALMAETQHGVDWKALSHAVRVGEEALELLTTGRITFPIRNRAEVLAIKLGQRTYQAVSARIESLLDLIEEAAARSSLPERADLDWIDDFVCRVHRDASR